MDTDKSKLFSFRPGKKLLEKFEKAKLSLGLSSSDAAREALDSGLETLLQREERERDITESIQLESEPKKTLLSLLKKESTSLGLTRVEWQFLASYVNKTYENLSHTIEVIARDLLIANLHAFSAFIKLRDSLYPSDNIKKGDAYYFGNLSYRYVNYEESRCDIQTYVTAVIAELPEYPNIGIGVYASRNLDGALRDDPLLDIGQINAALRPYLKSLLLVAIRGYWHRSEYAPLTKNNKGYHSFISLNIPNVPFKNKHFIISTSKHEDSTSCCVIPDHQKYIFTLNDYVEITDFYALLNRMGPEGTHAKVPGFTLVNLENVNNNKSEADAYMLDTGRFHHYFNHAEFESLKSLMNEYLHNADVKNHMDTLERVYGKI